MGYGIEPLSLFSNGYFIQWMVDIIHLHIGCPDIELTTTQLVNDTQVYNR